jgi:hypothetical protein
MVSEHKIDEEANSGSHTTVVSPSRVIRDLGGISLPNPDSRDVEDNEQGYALRESMRSVYRLWKMSRRTESSGDDREEFIRVAKEVVGLP